ncbi:MAG: PAS domain S-box-containing protein [Candidatus Azotimanducaceae bacterium]|jgi:PAS domain S-box-containing protein
MNDDHPQSAEPSAELDTRQVQRDATSARLSSALAAGEVGAWSWELDTQMVICDAFAAQLMSLDPELARNGLLLETFFQTVLPEALEAVMLTMADAQASPDLHEADFRVCHASGDQLWLRARGRADLGQDGKISRRHGVLMDVTAQKHSEIQLRRTTQLLEASQSIARVGGWELDTKSGQLFWTDETYRIHDTSPDTFNPTVEASGSYFLPESRLLVTAALDAAIKQGTGYDLELETLTTKGRLINVRATCVVTLSNGKPVKVTGTFQDITEQKRAEKTYRASEDRFRMLVEGTSDIVTITDVAGRFTYVNNQTAKVLGLEIADIIGRPAFDFAHPDDLARSRRWFADSIAMGEAQDPFEVRFVHQDGTVSFFIWSSTFHFDEEGLLTHINSIAHNNTSRRQAQEEHEHLAAIVENSADAIVGRAVDGNITSWNSAAEKLFGYAAEEIVGTPISRLVPDDGSAEAQDILARLNAEETIKDLETVRRSKDGRLVQVSATIYPIKNADAQVTGSAGIFRDITARKLAEAAAQEGQARLAIAMQIANIGHWDWDIISGEVDFSAEWKAHLGFAEDELSNKFEEFESRVHPDDRLGVLRAAEAARDDPAVGYATDFRLRHKDGSYRWMHAKALMILDSQGVPVRMIGAHVDLTEQKFAEQQAFRSQRLESLGTLASGVAHDLNNALTPILMGTELLRANYPNETSIIDVVEASALRGANMIRQLLNFPQGERGPRTEVDVGLLVVEMQNLMQGTFPKNINLQVTCAPTLPAVLGDATELHQVLLNLCVNARDAMPDGGTIALTTQYQTFQTAPTETVTPAVAGNYIVVTVSDTGAGIPLDIYEHIFDPFFTTKGIHKGTGLGLATVMGIVKGHAGFIKVQSKPEQGATFTVFLPVSDGIRVAPNTAIEKSVPKGGGETILFVDDEPAIREVMSNTLTRLNYQVLTAFDGTDGLSQALDSGVGIKAVITDLHMQNMEGLALARALRRERPDLPILVASGRMDDKVVSELLSLGVTDLLAKPFSEQQLAVALETLLARKE